MTTDYRLQTTDQSGQVVIILLLVVVLALAIALSVIGRSVTEVSTAIKSEDSSRAFSAAEAGIEKALLQSPLPGVGSANSISVDESNLSNNSKAEVSYNPQLPKAKTALEYPPYGKESFAQFWLATPSDLSQYYNQSSFNVYFGDLKPGGDPIYYQNNPGDAPAVEVNVIVNSGGSYISKKYLFDTYNGSDSTRQNNGFSKCSPPNQLNPSLIETNDSGSANRSFYCMAQVSGYGGNFPVMVRVRVLYSGISHPVAVKPVGNCDTKNCSLPPQASVLKSIGSAGTVQRRLQVFQQSLVMPQIFDFALFSAGSLSK